MGSLQDESLDHAAITEYDNHPGCPFLLNANYMETKTSSIASNLDLPVATINTNEGSFLPSVKSPYFWTDNTDSVNPAELDEFPAKPNDVQGMGDPDSWSSSRGDPDEEISRKKRHITKNLVILVLAILVLLTSLGPLMRLQSSLHQSEGLGTVCMAIQSMAMIVSCMFLPKIMITQLGHKWTMCISSASILLWTAANGYAVWATMIPAAILCGILSASLWTAYVTYLTRLAIGWHNITGENKQAVTSRFFGFATFVLALSRLRFFMFSCKRELAVKYKKIKRFQCKCRLHNIRKSN